MDTLKLLQKQIDHIEICLGNLVQKVQNNMKEFEELKENRKLNIYSDNGGEGRNFFVGLSPEETQMASLPTPLDYPRDSVSQTDYIKLYNKVKLLLDHYATSQINTTRFMFKLKNCLKDLNIIREISYKLKKSDFMHMIGNSVSSVPGNGITSVPGNSITSVLVNSITSAPVNSINCVPGNKITSVPRNSVTGNSISSVPGDSITSVTGNTISSIPGNLSSVPENSISSVPGTSISSVPGNSISSVPQCSNCSFPGYSLSIFPGINLPGNKITSIYGKELSNVPVYKKEDMVNICGSKLNLYELIPNKFNCDQCMNFKQHAAIRYFCEKCNHSNESYEILKNHMLALHQLPCPPEMLRHYCCSTCGLIGFSSQQKYTEHILANHIKRTYTCIECYGPIEKKLGKATKPKLIIFHCDECEFKTLEESVFLSHRKALHSCPYNCGYEEYYEKRFRQNHLLHFHGREDLLRLFKHRKPLYEVKPVPGGVEYPCVLCIYVAIGNNQADKMKLHLSKNHKIGLVTDILIEEDDRPRGPPSSLEDASLACDLCSYKARSQKCLRIHKDKHITQYQCQCGFKTEYVQRFNKHKKKCRIPEYCVKLEGLAGSEPVYLNRTHIEASSRRRHSKKRRIENIPKEEEHTDDKKIYLDNLEETKLKEIKSENVKTEYEEDAVVKCELIELTEEPKSEGLMAEEEVDSGSSTLSMQWLNDNTNVDNWWSMFLQFFRTNLEENDLWHFCILDQGRCKVCEKLKQINVLPFQVCYSSYSECKLSTDHWRPDNFCRSNGSYLSSVL